MRSAPSTARLQAGLRAALGAYQQSLDAAARSARALAANRSFQVALTHQYRRALQRALTGSPELRVEAPGGFRIGAVPLFAVPQAVSVVGPRGLVGRVIASVPLDSSLADVLAARAGLEPGDHVLVLSDGIVVAGLPGLTKTRTNWTGRSQTVDLGGRRYRGVASAPLARKRQAAFAVVTVQASVDPANRAFGRRYLLGLLVSIVLLGIVALLRARAILRAVNRLVGAANAIARGSLGERVPVKGHDEFAILGRAFNEMADRLEARLGELESERARLRDAFSRLGEALAATHDSEQRLRVIVETAVEATGASCGVLVGRGGEVVKIGDPQSGTQSLEVPLNAGGLLTFGTLVLYRDDFSREHRMTASSLVAQAVVSLDNARLHRIVERQALLDGLTGLANRRQSEEALSTELRRAERLGGPIALVLADLDSFKGVNDRYGHPAGDAVLREFAQVLRTTMREIDTVGRWGGEEFFVLLPGTSAEGGARLAERLREALASRPIRAPDGTAIRVTASFGVAAAPPGVSPDELVAAADAALCEAKRSGKNRVETAPTAARRP